jgi:DNA-binding transcriptional LysR family regulator
MTPKGNQETPRERTNAVDELLGVARWSALEVRHLVALKAVAEEGSFTRAAARLGYTQSAVSQQIAALDRIVGVRTLERAPGKRHAELTPIGAVLVRYADGVLGQVRAARRDVTAFNDGTASLRVGTYESAGTRIVPEVLRAFAPRWPAVDVSLHEAAGDAELLRSVGLGDLDLTFVVLPAVEGPFQTVELLRDPYVLVVPAGSGAADRSTATIGELLSLPLVGFRSCRNQPRLESYLESRGVEPNVVVRTDHNATLQGLVGAGVGCAVVARLTIDSSQADTAILELEDGPPPRLIGIAWHHARELSEPAKDFVEIAKAVCANLPSSDRRQMV